MLDTLQNTGNGWLEYVKAWGPVLVGLAGIVFAYWTNNRVLKQRRREEEREEIQEKLTSFYGPILQLLGVSRELYGRFRATKGEGFRTLIALLEGESFEGNDRVLLEQILDVTAGIDDLIMRQGGLVDDAELRRLFSVAGAHFRILRLAYEGDLTGEKERFREYVFPREITDRVQEEIERLQDRLDELETM